MKPRDQINHEEAAFKCAVLQREAATWFEANAFGKLQVRSKERRCPVVADSPANEALPRE